MDPDLSSIGQVVLKAKDHNISDHHMTSALSPPVPSLPARINPDLLYGKKNVGAPVMLELLRSYTSPELQQGESDREWLDCRECAKELQVKLDLPLVGLTKYVATKKSSLLDFELQNLAGLTMNERHTATSKIDHD
ncbi:hypothetical protein CRG98_005157 [Punica granatum]|uniref:Uncharacterized protein n=1 Tax=Punica granatum TaxID=22663 RepID=A0A2I0L196_PUNGR|nr:hypothetical protein CRG98_005157 [Punica granatum]